jgi:hypothetical protein
MSRAKIIQDIANHFKEITVSLETLIEVLDKTVSKEETKEPSKAKSTTASAEPKAETITLEKVRAVLAAKSKGGNQKEVKALITKHGGSKLTDLDTTCYEALLKEAEVL